MRRVREDQGQTIDGEAKRAEPANEPTRKLWAWLSQVLVSEPASGTARDGFSVGFRPILLKITSKAVDDVTSRRTLRAPKSPKIPDVPGHRSEHVLEVAKMTFRVAEVAPRRADVNRPTA